jgi:hypothetical protein
MPTFTMPTLRRGDDRTVLIGVSLTSGTLVGSQSVRCTLKRDITDADSAAALKLSTTDAPPTIVIVDATHIRLIFGHDATAPLEGRSYWIDIQVVTSGGLVETVEQLADKVIVKSDVTQTEP